MATTQQPQPERVLMADKRVFRDIPNLIDIQLKSFEWFLQPSKSASERKRQGLQEVFLEIFPIQDYVGNLCLEYIDYSLGLPMCKNCPQIKLNKKCLFDDCSFPEKDCEIAFIGETPFRVKFTPDQCRKRDFTYSIPLNIKVQLIMQQTGEVKEQEIFLVNLPCMTERGTFIINGAERVVVSQLHRSPGVYFSFNRAKKLHSAKIVPYRGAWMEFELDLMKDAIFVRLDRKRKIPITTFLRALGYATDEEIVDLFDKNETIISSLKYDKQSVHASDSPEKISKMVTESLKVIFSKLRQGDLFVEENARTLLRGLFFDPKKYDLGDVGRYKMDKKLRLADRLSDQILFKDLVDPATKEVLAKMGDKVSKRVASRAEALMLPAYIKLGEEKTGYRIMYNPPCAYVPLKAAEKGLVTLAGRLAYKTVVNEKTGEIVVERGCEITEDACKQLAEMGHTTVEVIKDRILCFEDIIGVVRYLIDLSNGIGRQDDIDHLSNRRIRRCGELLQNQFRISLSRMERVIKERMTIHDLDSYTPQLLINTRPVSAVVDEFFGSSQLSQFMDQTNPLAELTHKRRLSALGPGGLKRERAGYEVRDVHPTHDGRICPIETPEGPNAGLIASLAVYAKVDEFGFITTPLCRVEEETGKVNFKELEYKDAYEEDRFKVAQPDIHLKEDGTITQEIVPVKYFREDYEFEYVDKSEVEYVKFSPLQMVSVASALIPFLEHDDANRALMGTNMQRQAVPLIMTEPAIVGTGLEPRAAHDSGAMLLCRSAGTVDYVDANIIRIKRASRRKDDEKIPLTEQAFRKNQGRKIMDTVIDPLTGEIIIEAGQPLDITYLHRLASLCQEVRLQQESVDTYTLQKFMRSNQGTCINQKPIVKKGDKVRPGSVLADGPATSQGELALGRNILVAFMPWEGYNFEDAIILSERMVKDDIFTSIHIEEYEIDARDTKLGPEEITRDIPNVGEDALKNLNDDGIIRIGAEVEAGDILVGKVTPKGETELTAEDKLLRAIFGEKAREVRNTSLTVPHGEKGKVVDVMVFSRDNGDELQYGVNKLVRVFVAQKRKITVGDKMAGRHGNKGVISKIVPVEDMPYLADGRPIDIILNPLGVPSRMNVGQVLETHLGWAGEVLNKRYSTSIFNNGRDIPNEKFVTEQLKAAYEKDPMKLVDAEGKAWLYDGRTGDRFHKKIMVGVIYMLKLAHLVDDKMHARSTGPYSLVTQQPLGGKAQFGGQRFGEMEVWALEAYGAAHVLQELLTVKSDDVEGRVQVYETIIKGKNIMKPGIPESFKVVISELQSLGLQVDLKKDSREVALLDGTERLLAPVETETDNDTDDWDEDSGADEAEDDDDLGDGGDDDDDDDEGGDEEDGE
ncbi:MAG: DNA-directed RNA polymerase beta subunit [Candidatus Ozemobacter sibiricus]|jgi:DNA-directed RNA polymerase subunit beta|uniref:DNA-directed RNA polymerase subunit beta n=1 Tax=Candidatus Ozemobacter sibiricus TaxID=2268124 RepID=A0A367ZM36_9BACT|nr:MAG: DNA-directed RNA polymerase beta subunit [Candidatus Ozemobacter sibiricus]